MAASSSSGGHMMMASSSSSGKPCKYDVFLSFRGKDTRKIFIGHLHRALKRKTINAFIDSEDLIKGNKISELLTAIEDSRISIVVLSQHYASSEWCLKELVKILDCMDKKKQIVLPIFYQVDISDVRNINGTFAEDFTKHGENRNLDRQELESWRSALTRVADLSGWDSSKFEDNEKLIEEVVGDTLIKWIQTSSSKANGLVGMDSHITEMNSRLCLEVNDVRFIGIWGMPGLGKTTIARAIYNDIASQFEHSCFLYNVKETFINKGEVQMQKKLLSGLLNEKEHSFDLDRGRGIIMERLSTKKVLVVLDDVETFTQIEALLGEPRAFGDGSRIIVTTRDRRSLSGVDETYKPGDLSYDEALDLFRRYAFKTKNRQKGNYDPLVRSTIEYAKCLPLALKVLGAFLDNVSVCEWEDVLKKLKEIPNMDILQVLRTSFDDKLDGFVKDIFLDIACIFGGGYKKKFVTKILNGCGFFPHSGLRVLEDRALISMTKDSKEAEDDFQAEVGIHDLLQDMGKEIVRLESEKDPGKRSRLWRYEDVDRVLTRDTATDAVECLMLDLSKSEVDSYCINAGAFVRMTKLRYLMIYYSFHTIFEESNDHRIFKDDPIRPLAGCKQLFKGEMDLEFLSHELRFLVWHGCPLQFWPSTYIPKNLVQLDMRCSHITELWEGIKPLQNLKVVLLSRCSSLTKIPDLTEAINLETLLLDGCSSLVEVHPSISALENLVTLDLSRCKELKSLPPNISRMKSLQSLHLAFCSKLEKLPEISEVMNELKYLSLTKTAIKELPSSVNNLTGLVSWGLESCTELKTLPSSIHMSSLYFLGLSGCSSLEKFPEISGIMAEVSELYLDGTAIKGLPSSIDQLQGLRTLSMWNCKSLESLPDSICNLADLTDLDLSGCSALHNLPENLGDLQSLEDLNIVASGIRKLPFSIIRLGKLRGDKLSCFDCQEMTAPLSAWPSSTKECQELNLNKPQPRVHVDSCDTGVGFMETYEVGNKETARVKTLRVIDFSESSSYGLPHSFHGNESIAPTIHFEGLGAPSFPDQFETRKSGTEWEAESSETAAGRGTCQTLELLPERKEENEIIMVVAQWEGCQVLGSVCCCLSLSGCTLSLRRRETEREENRVTRISDGVEILELDSHSGLVVPDSQKEGKEEEELELMREESLARRGLLGPLCSCFYWLGELWHRKSEVAEPK